AKLRKPRKCAFESNAQWSSRVGTTQRIQENGSAPAIPNAFAYFRIVNLSRVPSSPGNIHCFSHWSHYWESVTMIFRIEGRDVCTGRCLSQICLLSTRVSAHDDKYENRKESGPFAKQTRFPILADQSTPGETAPARYHGNSRPILFRRWQTLPARSLRD